MNTHNPAPISYAYPELRRRQFKLLSVGCAICALLLAVGYIIIQALFGK